MWIKERWLERENWLGENQKACINEMTYDKITGVEEENT